VAFFSPDPFFCPYKPKEEKPNRRVTKDSTLKE
jgi:hypothetical protein